MAATVPLAIFVALFESAVWREAAAASCDDEDVARAMAVFEMTRQETKETKSSSSLVNKRRRL